MQRGLRWNDKYLYFVICFFVRLYVYIEHMRLPLREMTVTAKVQLTRIRERAAARGWMAKRCRTIKVDNRFERVSDV